MSQAFDQYRGDYEKVVEGSIAFSGLKHDFFLAAKVIQLEALFTAHFGATKPTLLDIGCGVGRMHPLIRPLTRALSGTDISTESLARAAQDNPAVVYRAQGADGGLPFADASHDATLAVCVLHHVPPPARAGFMAEMRRVTKPGGLAIIIEHNPLNPLTRLAVARCPFDHDAVLLRHAEAGALLERAGFSRIETRYFLTLPTLARPVLALEQRVARWRLGAQYLSCGVA
jgi:SAM-dependent methyltransferase